jgi:hypothetical protein
MQKSEPMKMRGCRLDDARWEFIEGEASKDKTGRTKASDVLRHMIDFYKEHKDKFKKK